MKNYIIVLFVLIFNHSFGQLDAIDSGKYSIQFNKEFWSITHYSWFSEYLDTKKVITISYIALMTLTNLQTIKNIVMLG